MAPSRVGRLLYGGVLFYTAVTNLRNLQGRIDYAEANGVPLPDVLVPAASALLLVGSVGITLWRYPRLSAAAVAAFLLGVTPTMHDFWNMEDGQRTSEKNQFVKNVSMLGAALLLLSRANGDEAGN
ncbi:MAG: DoxX family protein [Haloarculaceae archaeon]